MHEGIGIKRNLDAAADLYRRAARKSDAKAQYNLALCYLDGDGVRCSRATALRWLTKAASQRHRAARRVLKRLKAKSTV